MRKKIKNRESGVIVVEVEGGELEGGLGAKEGEKFEKSKGGRRLKRSVRRGGLFLRESDTWKETKGQGQQGQQGQRTKAEASCPRPRRL